jgi:hypothetical protein
MTKAELIKALADAPDNAELFVETPEGLKEFEYVLVHVGEDAVLDEDDVERPFVTVCYVE